MDKNLQSSIMRRVWALFVLRRATSMAALRIYLFAFLLWQTMLRVSLGHVWANMPKNYAGEIASFFERAFFNTETAVQALVLATGTVALWATAKMIKSIVRNTARQTLVRA
ncbi:MAG: hypothetical protein Q8R39_00195 [bacterium]|nr:hypothetical protein [bacterium]MDZ4284289.1 hypothetical protein [Patescibacteria group bacterium]